MSQKHPDYVVGIGASAGGLVALEAFFKHMPNNSGLAFVVIQHLSPNFKSVMNELLARYTEMQIFHAENGMDVQANCIYLTPPRTNMVIRNGQLRLTAQDPAKRLHLPINIFFSTLAEDCERRAISVVLSGTGSDGTLGIQSIHHNHGLVIVQDPESADFDGMPRNAIGSGKVDIVAKPEEMADKILGHVQGTGVHGEDEEMMELLREENALSLVFALLRREYRIDFGHYKLPTVLRRLERRMLFTKIPNIDEYVDQLRHDKAELDALYRDLLIEVTQFFRDQEAFRQIADELIPQIATGSAAGDQIRVWVPGCATGEEAYSIAMLFQEYFRALPNKPDIKIFATDVHPKSLEMASAGVYASERMQTVPAAFIERYFQNEGGNTYRVIKEVRQMVVFAIHNLTQDPPFTRMHLITCRNVLIYMRPSVQAKIMNYFHFGLRQQGYLMLGPSENIGELAHEFEVVDRGWRIFRKLRSARLPKTTVTKDIPAMMPRFLQRTSKNKALSSSKAILPTKSELHLEMLNQFMPDSLLVNQNHDLIFVYGNANQHLRVVVGEVTINVLKMLRNYQLQTAVRAALHRANIEQEPIVYEGVRTTDDANPAYVRLSVTPVTMRRLEKRYFLIRLDPISPPRKATGAAKFDMEEESLEQLNLLERELRHTKEHLKMTVEELEQTNEELQSTNEELIASNEELQSTNEELQSVNEELYTVNSEYQQKINELLQLTNDMRNLQRSSNVGTLFLDRHNRIRSFTPFMAKTFNLLPQDIGRPIDHLLYNLNLTRREFETMAEAALEQGHVQSAEIKAINDTYYLMRMLPYRTEAGTVEGTVLNMTNIDELQAIKRALNANDRLLDANANSLTTTAFNTPHVVRLIVTAAGVVKQTNESFAQLCGVSAEALIGRTVVDFPVWSADTIATIQNILHPTYKKPAHQQFAFQASAGEKLTYLCFFTPLLAKNGDHATILIEGHRT
ncbi:MAG: chemotaxis protein CheB [Candidatus Promineifilaceae bacterium]